MIFRSTGHFLKLGIITIAAPMLIGCATTTRDSVSGVNRSQLMLLPASYISNMSNQAYNQTLTAAKKKQTLNIDEAALQRVRHISNRLIDHVDVFRPDAKSWKWEVNLEKNDQLNAYCMPGGKIMVYSGLIEKLNATDDELAAVIGHEIAHALREHGRERMSQAYVQQFGLKALAAVFTRGTSSAIGNASMQAASMGSQLFFALPNSREQERESDRIGLELAARSGFNPQAAISLWQKMESQGGSKPPEFLSTHPASTSRISELRELMPRVMPLYEAAKVAK